MEEKEVLEQLGERRKKLRKERGWSQEILADFTGYHWKTISLLECGKLNPSFIFLWRIAKAFNISVADLFPEISQSIIPPLHHKELSAVFTTDIVMDSSEEEVNHLLTILKSLKKLRKR